MRNFNKITTAVLAIGIALAMCSCTKETMVKLNDCDCETLYQKEGVLPDGKELTWITDKVVQEPKMNCDDDTGNWLFISKTERKRVICFIK